MRLKDNLYRVVTTEPTDDGFRCQIRLDADHVIYKAHFPRNPVTPGVCLMQMAKEMMEERLGRRLQQKEVPGMKFCRTITPDVEPIFIYSKLVADGDNVSVKVSVEANGIKYANMTLRFEIDN